MSAAMHTPGPWIVEDYFVFASNTLRIADCDCDEQDMPESEIEANTRLIAAAPAMYEALKGMMSMYDSVNKAYKHVGSCPCHYCKAKQALAQAEGRQG